LYLVAFVPPEASTQKARSTKQTKKSLTKTVELPTDEEMIRNVEATNGSSSSSRDPFGPILPPDHPLLKSAAESTLRKLASSNSDSSSKTTSNKTLTKGERWAEVRGKMPPVEERNSKLKDFESFMDAMEQELNKVKEGGSSDRPSTSKQSTRNQLEINQPTEDEIEALEMEKEFEALVAENMDEEDVMEEGEVRLIRNFLESFKSQQGMAGPVGNLAGRMGQTLPLEQERAFHGDRR
jgi:hypothetical protein